MRPSHTHTQNTHGALPITTTIIINWKTKTPITSSSSNIIGKWAFPLKWEDGIIEVFLYASKHTYASCAHITIIFLCECVFHSEFRCHLPPTHTSQSMPEKFYWIRNGKVLHMKKSVVVVKRVACMQSLLDAWTLSWLLLLLIVGVAILPVKCEIEEE